MSDTRATYRTLVGWQISKIGIALGVLVLFVGVAASLGVKKRVRGPRVQDRS